MFKKGSGNDLQCVKTIHLPGRQEILFIILKLSAGQFGTIGVILK
jgi:hypothetical protein